ncbi:neuropeptide S [Phasianus colchicus]|uniref:neuropeptide S n=2 Tax=Phasianidae TaxID=9005 RepID=UPI00129E604E|nr:neuropeptide S [Phasianus colchicus]
MGTFADHPRGAMCCHPWVVTFGSGFASLHNLMSSSDLPCAGKWDRQRRHKRSGSSSIPLAVTVAMMAKKFSEVVQPPGPQVPITACLLCRLNLLYILWISAMFVCSGYPVGPSMSSNPFYLNCQLYGKSDYCLVLLNSCLAKVGRSEELALLKPPFLEMPFNKRSFRNGVGSGIKKTSFRRAKS